MRDDRTEDSLDVQLDAIELLFEQRCEKLGCTPIEPPRYNTSYPRARALHPDGKERSWYFNDHIGRWCTNEYRAPKPRTKTTPEPDPNQPCLGESDFAYLDRIFCQ